MKKISFLTLFVLTALFGLSNKANAANLITIDDFDSAPQKVEVDKDGLVGGSPPIGILDGPIVTHRQIRATFTASAQSGAGSVKAEVAIGTEDKNDGSYSLSLDSEVDGNGRIVWENWVNEKKHHLDLPNIFPNYGEDSAGSIPGFRFVINNFDIGFPEEEVLFDFTIYQNEEPFTETKSLTGNISNFDLDFLISDFVGANSNGINFDLNKPIDSVELYIQGQNGSDVTIDAFEISPPSTPEPSAMLGLVAVLGLGALAKKGKKEA